MKKLGILSLAAACVLLFNSKAWSDVDEVIFADIAFTTSATVTNSGPQAIYPTAVILTYPSSETATVTWARVRGTVTNVLRSVTNTGTTFSWEPTSHVYWKPGDVLLVTSSVGSAGTLSADFEKNSKRRR
jgi:hypothetical protein